MEQTQLMHLYQTLRGHQPQLVEQLPGAGSNRRYYRLRDPDGTTLIGCIGTSSEENRAFITLSAHLLQQGLHVPHVYLHDDDYTTYIQQDLGSVSLFDYLKQGRESGGNYSDSEVSMLRTVISQLPDIQFRGGSPYIFQHCYPQSQMDATSIMFDLNYFKYCYLKLTATEFNEYRLQADFERLSVDLLSEDADTFLYRDFQARNIMLLSGTPYYIDFQGGRRGPIYYDLASFLWQASAKYSPELRAQLVDVYWNSLQPYITVDSASSCYKGLTREFFQKRLQLFVLFRLLQVLGAYGYRGLWEKKKHFIESIPPALSNLSDILRLGICAPYPYLQEVLTGITKTVPSGITSTCGTPVITPVYSPLVVRVYSFSFKKGIPDDPTGNGGGYVFDCRSSNNPGRYAEYKSMTGLDKPVIDFLERDGEILDFLSHIYPIVDFHVQRWIERRFTSLQISFGCTGGQHRSVYCAQHVAQHLHDRFGVEVHLCHREQGILHVFK